MKGYRYIKLYMKRLNERVKSKGKIVVQHLNCRRVPLHCFWRNVIIMKALMKMRHGVGNIELVDVPEPICGPDGVKVEIKYAGICGTDIHIYHDTFKSYPPVILGHELSGVVAETGIKINNVKPGDRVAILGSSAVTCGTCEYCTQGYYMYCPIRRGMGHGVNGGFTKYVTVREDMVYKLPESVSLEEGALTEAFASAVQAIEEMTAFNIGDVVLLSGPGPIGLLCIALIAAHGCKVIAAGTGADETRLEIAKKLGADVLVNVDKDNLEEIVNGETGGKGADIAVECAGAEASISSCLKLVRKMGKYIQLGIAGRPVTVDVDQILRKRLRIFGSEGHSLKTWERTMRILEQRKVDLTPIITHKLPLSRWKEGFDLCETKGGGKVLLSYDE